MYYDDHYLYDSLHPGPGRNKYFCWVKSEILKSVFISIISKDFILRDELFENVIFKHT